MSKTEKARRQDQMGRICRMGGGTSGYRRRSDGGKQETDGGGESGFIPLVVVFLQVSSLGGFRDLFEGTRGWGYR